MKVKLLVASISLLSCLPVLAMSTDNGLINQEKSGPTLTATLQNLAKQSIPNAVVSNGVDPLSVVDGQLSLGLFSDLGLSTVNQIEKDSKKQSVAFLNTETHYLPMGASVDGNASGELTVGSLQGQTPDYIVHLSQNTPKTFFEVKPSVNPIFLPAYGQLNLDFFKKNHVLVLQSSKHSFLIFAPDQSQLFMVKKDHRKNTLPVGQGLVLPDSAHYFSIISAQPNLSSKDIQSLIDQHKADAFEMPTATATNTSNALGSAILKDTVPAVSFSDDVNAVTVNLHYGANHGYIQESLQDQALQNLPGDPETSDFSTLFSNLNSNNQYYINHLYDCTFQWGDCDDVTSALQNNMTCTLAHPMGALSMSDVQSTSAQVSWNGNDATTYHVYSCIGDDDNQCSGSYQTVPGNVSNLKLDNLQPGTTYKVYVYSANQFGQENTSNSNFMHFSTPAELNPPTLNSAEAVTTNSANLTWQDNDQMAVNYLFSYCPTDDDQNCRSGSTVVQMISGHDNKQYALSNLVSNTHYLAYVQGEDSSGKTSEKSNVVTFATQAQPLSTPALAEPDAGSLTDTTATLNWTDTDTTLTGFTLSYCPTDDQKTCRGGSAYTQVSINGGDVRSYQLTGLTANTSYLAYVQSVVGTQATSVPSNTVNFSMQSAGLNVGSLNPISDVTLGSQQTGGASTAFNVSGGVPPYKITLADDHGALSLPATTCNPGQCTVNFSINGGVGSLHPGANSIAYTVTVTDAAQHTAPTSSSFNLNIV